MNEPLPQIVLILVALALLATLLLGLVRIWLGPCQEDRMLTAQLFGTTGIALLLVLSEIGDEASLRNVALIIALLAVMSAVAFVSRGGRAVPDSLQQRNATQDEYDKPNVARGDDAGAGGQS